MNLFNAKSKRPYGSQHIASAEVLAGRIGLLASVSTFLQFLSTAAVSFLCSVLLDWNNSVSPTLSALYCLCSSSWREASGHHPSFAAPEVTGYVMFLVLLGLNHCGQHKLTNQIQRREVWAHAKSQEPEGSLSQQLAHWLLYPPSRPSGS